MTDEHERELMEMVDVEMIRFRDVESWEWDLAFGNLFWFRIIMVDGVTVKTFLTAHYLDYFLETPGQRHRLGDHLFKLIADKLEAIHDSE